jgi:hypothetical protein
LKIDKKNCTRKVYHHLNCHNIYIYTRCVEKLGKHRDGDSYQKVRGIGAKKYPPAESRQHAAKMTKGGVAWYMWIIVHTVVTGGVCV